MNSEPIIVYTDGAAFGNPGPGGWAAVMRYGQHRKRFARGYYRTTNNRMELMAVIQALKQIKQPGHQVVVYSDSRYIVNAVNEGWLFNWERKNFKGRKNADLWQEFLKVYRQHEVTLRWVKGHEGIEDNEACDDLAKAAAGQPELEDTGYTGKGTSSLNL
jgi:ribonuclease HI